MDARHLTHEQRAALRKQIGDRKTAIDRIVARMRERGWYDNDAALNALIAASAALRAALGALVTADDLTVPPPSDPPAPPATNAGLPDVQSQPPPRRRR
jgi:hypothetical protein